MRVERLVVCHRVASPTVRVKFHQRADEHEVYAPHAFDRLIGQAAPFKVAGVRRGSATVVAVAVDEDGKGATWTVDIDGSVTLRPSRPVTPL